MTTTVPTSHGPIKAIHIQVPVGIPTPDGGLEIPNRVFLGGIPTETTEFDLELFFSDYGAVKDVRIVTDRVSGECKGYGFVTFEEEEDISLLIRKKNILMKGRKLRIRKAVRRNGSQFTSDTSLEVSPDSNKSPIQPPQQASPVSPVNTGGQLVFVANQQQHAVPMGQVSPQQFGYQPVTHTPSLTFPNTTTYPIPAPAPHHPPPSNMHPIYFYPYVNTPQMQIPYNWPLYHQI